MMQALKSRSAPAFGGQAIEQRLKDTGRMTAHGGQNARPSNKMLSVGSITPTPLDGQLSAACGYVRKSEGTKVSIDQLKDHIVTFAAKHGFVLHQPIFVDACFASPLQRPALRALLDIVWELHIPTVILPSSWHLSQIDTEAAQVRQRLATYDCQLIFIRN